MARVPVSWSSTASATSAGAVGAAVLIEGVGLAAALAGAIFTVACGAGRDGGARLTLEVLLLASAEETGLSAAGGATAGLGAADSGLGGRGAAVGAAGAPGGLGMAGAGGVAVIPGLGSDGMANGLGGAGGMIPPGVGGAPGLGGEGMVGGAPVAVGRGLGGRLTIAASRGLAAPGFPSRRGGRVMRTVSFFGSFMAGFSGAARQREACASQVDEN